MPQNNNYKQDFLAIKYDYDTQCLPINIDNIISNLDNQIKSSGQALTEPITNNINSDVSGAFAPIGQYYSNLLDIKERLNTFLEDATGDIGESQGYLMNQERYDNRAHPEESVSSKEIAYGFFSELRPSTIPILMALGTFMACISVLMIFQMIGFTGQINVPPAAIAFQTWLATPGQVPAYQNPMILSGIIIILGVAVVLLGVTYLRSNQP